MKKLLNTFICILLTSPLAAFDISLEGVEFGFLQLKLGEDWSLAFNSEEVEVVSETISLSEGDIMQVLDFNYGTTGFNPEYISPAIHITSNGIVTAKGEGYIVGPASIRVGYIFPSINDTGTWEKRDRAHLYFVRADYAILRAGASTQSSYVTIPANPSGNFEVKLQTSTDLQTWTPTTPGVFPYGNNAKFFRLVVE